MRAHLVVPALPATAACASSVQGTRTEPTRITTTSTQGDAEVVVSDIAVETMVVPAPPPTGAPTTP